MLPADRDPPRPPVVAPAVAVHHGARPLPPGREGVEQRPVGERGRGPGADPPAGGAAVVYDTFLPNFPGTSIGLIRACQLVERLAVRDVHDAPVNIVALEQGSAYVAEPVERAVLGRWS